MLELLAKPSTYVSLISLSAMEVVLGIDNIVFLSILAGKLPEKQQPFARRLGLAISLLLRILLLFGISWVMGLTVPLFAVFDKSFSGRDLILLGGGLFLVAKSTHEIYEKLEVVTPDKTKGADRGAFGLILLQIIALDMVFSLDSVITAIGMAKEVSIMVVAMVVAMIVMLIFAGSIGDFVNRHPSMKILALAFLLLIGVMLVAEGMGQHVSKGYIYSAMAFSLVVELLNMRFRKKHAPVVLHRRFQAPNPTEDG